MSSYENYEASSKTYDQNRVPSGVDIMTAMLQFHTRQPLQDLHVLDAGCGTGNYAKAMLDLGVGHVTLLDASHGMLDKAKEKLADYVTNGRVKDVVETKLPSLPFQDVSFDAVMFNVVLHHFGDSAETGYPTIRATLLEARRVLRPGGILIVTTCLPDIFQHALWFCKLSPSLTARFYKVMPSAEAYQDLFKFCKYDCITKLNLLGADFMSNYFDAEGPLSAEWRKGNSYWNYATPEELKMVEKYVKELKDAGRLEAWMREEDHTETFGCLSLFICKASAS